MTESDGVSQCVTREELLSHLGRKLTGVLDDTEQAYVFTGSTRFLGEGKDIDICIRYEGKAKLLRLREGLAAVALPLKKQRVSGYNRADLEGNTVARYKLKHFDLFVVKNPAFDSISEATLLMTRLCHDNERFKHAMQNKECRTKVFQALSKEFQRA